MNLSINPFFAAAGLLVLSNVFMTFAWYAHLRNLGDKPWLKSGLVKYSVAAMVRALFSGDGLLLAHCVQKISGKIPSPKVHVDFALT